MYQIIEITQKNTKGTISYGFDIIARIHEKILK